MRNFKFYSSLTFSIALFILITQNKVHCQDKTQVEFSLFDTSFQNVTLRFLKYPKNWATISSDGSIKLNSTNNFLLSSGNYLGQIPVDMLSKIKSELLKLCVQDEISAESKESEESEYYINLKSSVKEFSRKIITDPESEIFRILYKCIYDSQSFIINRLTPVYHVERTDTLEPFFSQKLREISFSRTLGESYMILSGKLEIIDSFNIKQKRITYDFIDYDSISGKSSTKKLHTSPQTRRYLYKIKADSIYQSSFNYCPQIANKLKDRYIYCVGKKHLKIDFNKKYGLIGIHKNFEKSTLITGKKERLSYLEIQESFNPTVDFSFPFLKRHCSEFYWNYQFDSYKGLQAVKLFNTNQSRIAKLVKRDIIKNKYYLETEPNYDYLSTHNRSTSNLNLLSEFFKIIQLSYFKFRIKINSWRTLNIAQQHAYYSLFDNEFAYGIIINGQMRIIIIDSYGHTQLETTFRNKNEEFLIKKEDELDSYSDNRITLFKSKERKYAISEFQYYLYLEELKKLKDAKLNKTLLWGANIEKLQNNSQLKLQIKREYRRRLRKNRRTKKNNNAQH